MSKGQKTISFKNAAFDKFALAVAKTNTERTLHKLKTVRKKERVRWFDYLPRVSTFNATAKGLEFEKEKMKRMIAFYDPNAYPDKNDPKYEHCRTILAILMEANQIARIEKSLFRGKVKSDEEILLEIAPKAYPLIMAARRQVFATKRGEKQKAAA